MREFSLENHRDIHGRNSDAWPEITRALHDCERWRVPRWDDIYAPLARSAVDGLLVVGQVGQSLDGRMTPPVGHSKYINRSGGLTHLHKLRAMVDAIVIGVGTALADDPLLTVRHVAGTNPARVVVDPNGRLPAAARLLAEDGAPRLVLTAETTRLPPLQGAEIQRLPSVEGRFAASAIVGALAARGWRRILVEGGPDTLSGFLRARLLDRLHLIVSPIMFSAGRPGFAPPPIARINEVMRAPRRVFGLDEDVLLDFDLSGQRAPLGEAKTST